MAVRAKFKVIRIERTTIMRKSGVDEKGRDNYEPAELNTIVMTPVYSSDPEHENHKFWSASPSGEIKLGTVNADAVSQLVLDGEFYVDFTPAG